MAPAKTAPRKQRTRKHVIADLSVNYVERFILDEGHTLQFTEKDYGYDLLLFTYDEEGYIEPGLIFLQLKAAEALEESGPDYVFDLDVRDFNLWMIERLPVVLISFDATKRRAYWLHVQRYFRESPKRRPKRGAKTVRVRVPRKQAVTRRAVARIRTYRQEILKREERKN